MPMFAGVIEALEAAHLKRCADETAATPFVTLAYAQGLDGSIAGEVGKPLRLSGSESMVMTHLLRAWHDGIMVGVSTVVADDPSLTVRLCAGDHPLPVVLDPTLRTPPGCKLLTSSSCRRRNEANASSSWVKEGSGLTGFALRCSCSSGQAWEREQFAMRGGGALTSLSLSLSLSLSHTRFVTVLTTLYT